MATPPPNLRRVEHPLIDHLMLHLRDAQTEPPRFRQLVRELGALLAYEAGRDLPTVPATVPTPMEPFTGRALRMPITIVPILRAGLAMADGALDVYPDAQVGHLGMTRNEETLEPVHYFQKMPPNLTQGAVLLVDPMLATGGSAAAAMGLLKRYGCRDVRMVCMLAAPQGLERLHRDHPDVPIFAAACDRELNAQGFILPGLGDAGDRIYGTG